MLFEGNDNLNLMTISKRYKLRIDLADFNGTTRYAEYDNFVVQSSTDNYKLSSLGTYSGTAGYSVH
jgi:Fibrinogen beta and gamma chains, C-terminal globular domain